jgi:hypothetical protein
MSEGINISSLIITGWLANFVKFQSKTLYVTQEAEK